MMKSSSNKVFPLKVFRDHIYQEARMKTGSSYWMNKAKEKTHENGANDETKQHRR